MWKFTVILLLTATAVLADEEIPQKHVPRSSVVETVLCYVSPKPWSCVKEQTARMLNQLEEVIEEKKHELMVEADEEIKESARDLSEDEKKEAPSTVISSLDKGFSAMANLLTEEFEYLRGGRDARALKKGAKDIVDDANDFNDDDIYDAFGRVEAEGNLSDEARAKMKGNKAGAYEEDGGYGYGGYRGKGKKGKKGKKGLMKMFFLGAVVKSKIELLLKILSFHLQLKFFAIALAGLVINLARFWIDLKKSPQKHHYDEHDDWGSNWKRQSGNQQQDYSTDFAHRFAYNGQPQYQQ